VKNTFGKSPIIKLCGLAIGGQDFWKMVRQFYHTGKRGGRVYQVLLAGGGGGCERGKGGGGRREGGEAGQGGGRRGGLRGGRQRATGS